MGTADRDYMRERRPADADFRPPRRRGPPTWAVVLVCCAVLAGLYRAADGYLSYRAAQDDSPRRAKAAAAAPIQGQELTGSRPRSTGDLPVAQDRSGSESGAPGTHRPATVQTFSKCVDLRGRTVYSDSPCAAGERMSRVEVRSDVNVVDAEPIPSPSRSQAYANAQAAATPQPSRAPQFPAYDPRAACTSLDQAIAGYDAQARQAHSGQMQDWISARRKEARDQQFRMRC